VKYFVPPSEAQPSLAVKKASEMLCKKKKVREKRISEVSKWNRLPKSDGLELTKKQ